MDMILAAGVTTTEFSEVDAYTLTPEKFATLTFQQASDIWLASRANKATANTIKTDMYHLRVLLKFFSKDAPLNQLSPVDLHHYQHWRQQAHPEIELRAAGASAINHELSVVQQLLKKAGLWHRFRDWYEPLPLPKSSPGKALEQDQEETLFKVASEKPRWLIAYCASIISANTTAGPAEIRHLQLRDVDLEKEPPMIYVREGTKNNFRVRPIPLNQDAEWAVRTLLERAKKFGACEPDHYLIPHRAEVRNGSKPYDPTRPATSWRSAWRALRKKAGMPWLRPYDLRHHAITRLLENPEVSERTVIDIAGHVSRKMLQRYSHIRLRHKREAVNALCSRSGTHITKENRA